METQTIFFVGKPVSGKGTQATLLSSVTGWPIISTSGAMRTMTAEGGAVGKKLRESMDAGILTPYWLAAYIFLESLFSVPENGNVIFDGANRTLLEAQIVMDSLAWLKRPYHMFHLQVSDAEVRKRVELRRGKENRLDDHAVDKRLEEYYAHTAKVVEFYRTAGVLIEVNGEQAPEAIAADIKNILKI
ncbi:TPA: hypothetical protein DIV48_00720 [Candidatus Kaiserbacteria bacterium]|nr:MAG: Adenylate kinase [Parcubacteria group bacterium GW2011_GWA1_56_13]KKW45724.1 MAG: Adenylate kinase [Parcubacteria group bacterium GW2011_GWB1_57_6]HCR52155.1 hypothetical protein [Candidatus Kaiserbacteria bacterium]